MGHEKFAGVKASPLLRERLEKVAALLQRPAAQAWARWDAPSTSPEFRERVKAIWPLRDELALLIYGRPRMVSTIAGVTTVQEPVPGVGDDLHEALACLGILPGPRPNPAGQHLGGPEFIGPALGLHWLIECRVWCRDCRSLAVREIAALLAAAPSTPPEPRRRGDVKIRMVEILRRHPLATADAIATTLGVTPAAVYKAGFKNMSLVAMSGKLGNLAEQEQVGGEAIRDDAPNVEDG